jgi:transcriptional regulator with XRE-family HTH domain
VPLPPSSSSAWQARQALGARLGEIRKDAGLTGRALAELCGWHESKVSRIEHARTAPSADDLRLWCQRCRASAETDDLLAFLRSVEDMFVEWRRMERTGLKRAQEAILPLWERTRIFRAYSGWLIPGVVQTPAYTKAILRAIATRRGLPDDTDEAADVRADRLRLLREGDHRFFVVMEESLLRTVIGGTDVMAGQLGHLITVASLPSVSLGIIPTGLERVSGRELDDCVAQLRGAFVGLARGQVQCGESRAGAECRRRRLALPDQFEGLRDRVAGFPRCGGRGPLLAVGAQDGGDHGFPGFCGGSGVDRGGGLAVEALFQQGHDFDLAAVEEPGADAVVGGP